MSLNCSILPSADVAHAELGRRLRRLCRLLPPPLNSPLRLEVEAILAGAKINNVNDDGSIFISARIYARPFLTAGQK